MLDRSRRSFIILGAAGVLSACAGTVPQFIPAGDKRPESLTREQILAAINAVRKANGQAAWTYNPQLETAARSQANLMAAKDKLSHDLGVTLRERVTAAGYYGAVGENLAGGHKNLEQAIQGWMGSSGHRSTLLSPKFTEFGLAVARVSAGRKSRYGLYWAMIAGGPFSAWLQ
ncbi:CAP domain-containing protein [Devosia rhodophyticola]|uniref:CAP domain-containing protein n=1 Tax=Devosia rhodophyticola TaxID=3026423 RepID=A0ABY7YZ82_9HYPH|nr:CAP domain-containing protein [Devosia rhodophyticola]WDR06659.1 CAP domain-containing protein [Devosia rhodophyticola]